MAEAVSVERVRDGAGFEAFLAAARVAEAGNPRWVEPARTHMDALLGAKSPVRAENEIALFVARRGGQPVGRIAAVVNRAHLAKYADRTGHFGLFETIDDAAVTAPLVAAAAAFLRERGLVRLTGPFSLTINHETGLLVEGFDEPHVAHTNHAPPFYGPLLEAEGLRKVMDVEAWVVRPAATDFPARVAAMAARVPESEAIVIEGTTLATWAARTRLINDLYNEIWAQNWGAVPVSDAEGRMIAQLTLATSKLAWLRVAFYRGEPIALLTQIPDVNEGLQGLGGRLLPFGWSRLLWRIHARGTRLTRIPMFGMKRAWHRTRIGALAANRLMADALGQARAYGAEEVEISWILETNTVFRNMMTSLPARRSRLFRLYGKDI